MSGSARASGIAALAASLFSEGAVNVGGVVERTYGLANLRLRVRFAGLALYDRMAPPLAHLLVGDETDREPDLTIHAWDSSSTGVAPFPLPQPQPSDPPGSKYYHAVDGVQISYQPASGAASIYDSNSAAAWYWCDDHEAQPDWEAAAPFRQIFHWWLPRQGVAELHGGAIGTPSGGVLILGRGGKGKSTTALSSVGFPGLRYAGDDYVGVRTDPSPEALSLYCSGKLEPRHATRLPQLQRAITNAERLDRVGEDKVVFNVFEHFPQSTIAGFPLKALLLPMITDRVEHRFVPASSAAALAALAPSTLLQLHPPDEGAWKVMVELVRRLPSYTLELGSDIDAIPAAVLRFLETIDE